MNHLRIAILDDYQQVAASYADWDRLGAEVVFFSDHVDDHDLVVDRLAEFDVVVAMRERTAFPRQLLSTLPHLRLLITTGMNNAAIDMAAARELGIVVSGTASPGMGTAELSFGLILSLARNLIEEVTKVRHAPFFARSVHGVPKISGSSPMRLRAFADSAIRLLHHREAPAVAGIVSRTAHWRRA